MQTTQTKTVEQQAASQRVANITRKTLVYTFLTIMAIFMLIPFYWMINTSLMSDAEVAQHVRVLFPTGLRFSNFSRAWSEVNLGPAIINTVAISIVSTIFGTIFSIFLGFALSRLNFKGKEILFTILLATMMIPGEMMVLTNFVTVGNLGWLYDGKSDGFQVGPYLAMTVPFLVSIFHVYLLRNTFRQIPNELYYAAKVDGTSDWKYLWKIMVPIAKSSIVTIIILKLMGAWNSYVWPNLVGGKNVQLVTTALRNAFTDSNSGTTQIHLQMAATILVTVPLLLLFVIFRKYIMSGVSRSGIKG